METTNPYPPPVSPHKEVENNNRQPVFDGEPVPVDDVARNNEQFMELPEISGDHRQPPPPVGDGDENRQPEIAGSSSEVFVQSPMEVIEEVEYHHHQEELLTSVSPPENSFDGQIPPPKDDGEQPFARQYPVSLLPPSMEAEHPSENISPNRESPLSKQSPSPIEAEYPPGNSITYQESPSEHLKQPPSPSPSPPPTEAEYLPENVSSNHESPLSKQPQSPSLSVSPPPAEADYPPENLSPKHESPQPASPSPSLPLAEAEYPPENQESTLSNPPSPIGAKEVPESPKLKQSPKDLSPSPPHDTLEPNTRTPPLGVPLLLQAAATFSSPTRPQISPWTHQETANLIQAYQEKWYSLKKGPLKAGQWEEVAITVAARCGYDEPTKTSKQCRHKIEKLRKRYRTERGKPRSKATAWNFFKLMDNLEKGPLPISSSQPMELVEYQKPSTSNGKKRKNDVYDDSDFFANKRSSTSRATNSNHYVANGGLATNLRFSEGGNRIVRGLRTSVIHKRKEVYQEQREEENNENVCEEEEDVAGQLAAEIKGFAEKFVKMEKSKIEMMRDVERYRLEMENKRMEMIIESQQMLVETVNNAFRSSVKTHRLSAG